MAYLSPVQKGIHRSMFKLLVAILILLSLISLGFELINMRKQLQNRFANLPEWSLINLNLGLGIIFLIPANWGLEALKWKLALLRTLNLAYKQAYQSVVAGTATSLLTPNKVGEFAGRILLLPEVKRKHAVGLNIVCSLSQLWATVLFGTIAIGFYSDILHPHFSHEIFYGLIAILGCILVISIGALILKIKWMAAWVMKKGIGAKLEPFFSAIAGLSKAVLTKLMLISILRYIVFLMQHLLALWLFGLNGINFMHASALVAMVYFFTALLPINNLLEIGIRSGATLHLWQLAYPEFATTALLASLFIWLCNVAIPALAGNILLFGLINKIINK